MKDIDRNYFSGIGKPEPLRGEVSGFWSRRIDETNRLVYRICDGTLEILISDDEKMAHSNQLLRHFFDGSCFPQSSQV